MYCMMNIFRYFDNVVPMSKLYDFSSLAQIENVLNIHCLPISSIKRLSELF